MSRSPAREPFVLLVHGAHHGSWCWEEVTERLRAAGVRGHAIDLPLTSFTDDTETVRAAVREAAGHGPVLLVAHSYGGLPVSAGGHAAARLVYVAARMPLPGESPAQLTPTWNDPAFHRFLRAAPDGTVTLLPAAREALYSATPPRYAERAAALWRPMSSRVPDTPLDDPAWLTVPSAYVVCATDRTVRPEAQRACATRAAAHVELDCDHSPFYSAPESLAQFLATQAALLVPQ
ncbi:alpha/beta fold hydrolase [Streptomyces ipomoeae]|uniref:alpha/beta fold hydrolase n=1 Tax=Streptomyces ipomoeae TaxID=103232 RepID=UPI0011461796|nr:alpha/beta fold hydrolase [Streptomyces ipomoeae]MDX2936152.1 alpha/beta fold hydrolase [Streptomyces ipomoeae]TQE31220.1 alpha/beta fold hydrolase [Streptomyces ipomoeae]